jgi:hypothetical protein
MGDLESEIVHEVRVNDGMPLALVGRVPVKVTDRNGPIKRGDVLVTADKPGYAMRADEADLGFGMIIGKAMQTHESGDGTIIVLVNLQ